MQQKQFYSLEHVYNEPANLTESYAVHFDINGPLNVTEMVPVIGMGCMLARARLRCTRDYFATGICTLLYSKVHGAKMRPTWGRKNPDGPHVGPMNLAIWVA